MGAKRVAGACAAVVAGALGLCQTATAADVAYQSFSDRSGTYAVVFFTAAPGEVNDTTVALTPEAAVVTDPGKRLQVDPAFAADTSNHCTFDGDRAVCKSDGEPFVQAVLSLGDGNDKGRVDVSTSVPSEATVWPFPYETGNIDGGPGNDKLVGSGADDWLVGGSGADDISGGGGLRDVVNYAWEGDQTTGVRVTLDGVADDGHPGEHDNVRQDIEFVGATEQGDSTLVGNASNNALFGGGGNDVLRGGAGSDELNGWGGGNDVLDGGLGPDTFIGSGGNDTLWTRDAGPELRITCGGGTDTVYADALDSPDPDCENVIRG